MKIIRNPRASGGGAVDATTLAATINAATSKTTPVDADQFPITDSAASGALRRFTFANLWAWIRGLTDARYAVQTVTTGPFTAIVGRRFITENAGTLQINDPTTRSDGSALVAGDSYEVIVGSGTINFNGILPNYAPSRFMVRRRWNGSAWVTPTPVLSDTLQVGTGSWSGSSFSGPQSFTGQVELVGQSATNGTSAMTRALGDARYAQRLGAATLTATADAINTTTLTDRVVVANLVSGVTYIAIWSARFSGVNPIFRLNYTGTFDRETATAMTGNSGAGGTLRNAVLNANFDSVYSYGGQVCFRATSNGTLSLQHAQLVSGASTAAMQAGAFLEVRPL